MTLPSTVVLIRLLLICVCIAAIMGCYSPPEGFDSPVPSKRMDAAILAAGENDQASIPDLIEMLDSDDALVRLVAIRSLERITGELNGYDYASPEWERSAAVNQWADWALANGHGPDFASNGIPPEPIR